ncbi:MAG: hypothetical protein A2445_02675 [Candidatus Jacksonbacteria bacterium RIFOXYC2_FULL_44_29]|nr:MAG: hypothetical protein UV19_C0002G0039 [Parcubacteria group bacterium GW2011_GWA2_42_28]KKT55907.1 MAG: hypothetical protein UW45_C0003G0040 [Parcubacteria group bacterium GW2011_GWC2_44_22]OGY74521.1 MAG: hypothetical protein A2240_02930 [Candidatus Jacksonbacteria bacterium RIFOXYA2_FULL_43_12]OGY77430.1 MAG: hypothetical protein A2295_01880 [Candidatus Jacksonbacteria bacterium RIFOXYB2_FULL_44_15]OGY78202.1 MAG: hypothetical protein A2550_06225 [Candidatus Jacksonbacteria bacterium RI
MPEIMASITVMAVLAGTGVTNAVNQISQAKLIATMDEMKAVRDSLMAYQQDYPGDTISTITTLVTKGYLAEGFTDAPNSDLETNWKEDAWGKSYALVPPAIDQDGDYLRGSLESAGPDGKTTNDPATTDYDEAKDNIKITLEPIVAGG